MEEAKRMDVLKGHCLADHLHISKRELQSMRRLVRIKGYVLKAVINAVLKSELWIGDRQEATCRA